MPKGDNNGHPPFQATDEEREIVAILAGNMITQKTICRFVKRPDGTSNKPISLATLKRHFPEELKEGIDIADAKLVNKGFEMAMAGNVQAWMYIAKMRLWRLGWKEAQQEVHLTTTYGELIEEASRKAEEQRTAGLKLLQGGKAA